MSAYQPELSQYTSTAVDRRDDDGVIVETRENLSRMRAHEAHKNFMCGSPAYSELERAYGQYLFVPFAIPRIQAHDQERFVAWYYAHARHASKQIEDFSSGTFRATNKTYQTVDSTSPGWTPVWSLNSVPEVYTEFPELFEQIHDLMPWVGDKAFRWNMWSSANNVPAHRDHTSCVDAPLAMRIKLFDSNLGETLSLLTDPMLPHENRYQAIPDLRRESTNSFTWNNLRTKHRSVFMKSDTSRKILFIWRDVLRTDLQVQQYADLMDRSIAQYNNTPLIWRDTHGPEDYINVE